MVHGTETVFNEIAYFFETRYLCTPVVECTIMVNNSTPCKNYTLFNFDIEQVCHPVGTFLILRKCHWCQSQNGCHEGVT